MFILARRVHWTVAPLVYFTPSQTGRFSLWFNSALTEYRLKEVLFFDKLINFFLIYFLSLSFFNIAGTIRISGFLEIFFVFITTKGVCRVCCRFDKLLSRLELT